MDRTHRQKISIAAVILVAMIVSISCASETDQSIGACISRCNAHCRGRPNYDRCFNGCSNGCIPRTPALSPLFYCNFGCSLHKCSNITTDEKLMASCLENCSNVQCKA